MKKKIVALMICGVIAVGMVGCGLSTEETASGEPVVYDRMNGLDTDVIGQYSILEIPQEEVTTEYLTDWYENYVIPSEHSWDIIVYSDRDDGLGVWASDTTLNKDVYLKEDESTQYAQGGNSVTTVYYNLKDGELVPYFDTTEYGAAQGIDPIDALNIYYASGDYIPSKEDFIYELEFEGYSPAEIETAVASVDWSEIVIEDLLYYYDTTDDINTLHDLLEDDGFTEDEIQYAFNWYGIG